MNDKVAIARWWATVKHEGQVRAGGEPYIRHPRRVAEAVAAEGGSEDAVAAAWLHDVVEDSDCTLQDLRDMGFSDATVAGVDSVTRRPDETYMQMIARACADPIGRVVKWHDNADNSDPTQLEHFSPERRAFAEKRYARARRLLEQD